MSRDFTKVSPAVWRSKRFRSTSFEARLLYLYLLTCEHQNNTGCYRLPPGYACSDMGCTGEEFTRARDELVTLGILEADNDTEEVLLPNFLKHSPPMNAKHLKGVQRTIEGIESDRLRQLAESELETVIGGDVDGHGSGNVMSYPSSNDRLANTPMVRRAGDRR